MAEHFKHCKYCGREFITTNHRIGYCSDECRKKMAVIQIRRAVEKQNRKRAKIPIPVFVPKEHPERDKWIELAEITGIHYGTITAYWDDKQKLKKVLEYKQSIGEARPVNLNKVFERYENE